MTTHEFAPEQTPRSVGSVYIGEDGEPHLVTGFAAACKPAKTWPGEITPDSSAPGGYRFVTTKEAAEINGEPYEPVMLSEHVSGNVSTEE